MTYYYCERCGDAIDFYVITSIHEMLVCPYCKRQLEEEEQEQEQEMEVSA